MTKRIKLKLMSKKIKKAKRMTKRIKILKQKIKPMNMKNLKKSLLLVNINPKTTKQMTKT